MKTTNDRASQSTTRNLHGLSAVLLTLAIYSVSLGEITSMIQHGTPTFKPGGFAYGSMRWDANHFDINTFEELQQDLLAPFHGEQTWFGPADGPFDGAIVYPGEPHAGPYEGDVRRSMADLGVVNTDVLLVEDVRLPQAIVHGYELVPTGDAPLGASLDDELGPVIPNDVFPIKLTWRETNRGIAIEKLQIHALDNLPGFEGVSVSHLPWLGVNWWAQHHSSREIVGSYRDEFTLLDKNGNGWTLTSEFEVVESATDVAGDLNYNGELDAHDLNILTQNVVVAPTDGRELSDDFLRLDMNGDASVDVSDVYHWVTDLKSTWIGDANLDGEFNSTDFIEVFQAGKYETGELARWNEGDWNGDELFDSSDFIAAFQDGGYEMGARAAIAAVPEPSSLLMLMFGMLGIGRIRRR